MEAGVGSHLPRGEADVAHSHRQGLAAAPRGAEQGLLGHLAEGSDDRHVGTCGGEECVHATGRHCRISQASAKITEAFFFLFFFSPFFELQNKKNCRFCTFAFHSVHLIERKKIDFI